MLDIQRKIDALAADLKTKLDQKKEFDPALLDDLQAMRRERDTQLAGMSETERAAILTNGNGDYSEKSTETNDAVAPELTEDALALEFTLRHALDWRFVAAWGDWLKWDGTRWKKESTLHAFDRIRRICRQAADRAEKPKQKVYSASTVAGVERLARSDRRHASTTDAWDLDPWLLNTPGGVVNLKSGETKAHERDFYMTKLTAGNAANPGRPSQWLSFLNDVTNGDVLLQSYLARVAGYALTGSTQEHALFFFYGTGANGKSVFLNTLAAVLGDYAANAAIDTFMESRNERHPTDLAALRGARAVIAMEVENGRRWAESKIKSLVGGDKITARFMRQDFFEYRPQFKLLIAGNHKPGLRDVDEAMRRRLHLIPFTVTIPAEKRDKELPIKLMAEKDFIMQWAIAGCVEWQERGLMPPPCVTAATEEYFQAEDTLQRWVEEMCTLGPNEHAESENLFESWKLWAERASEYVVPRKRFIESLVQRNFNHWRNPLNDKRGFRGISLK